jgi:drug/metabolite transporter (DMT)-like permease
VCIYDYWIYGVKINKTQTIALIVSFIGVFLTANGSYLVYLIDSNYELDDSKFTNYQTSDPMVMTWAAIIMVVMMALHSSGVIMTKKLRGVHTAEVNFIQGIMIFFSGGIAYPNIL